MPDVNLFIGDRAFAGWKSVTVTRSLEKVAGRFDLDLTDREPPDLSVRAIREFAAFRLELDGETLLSGVIDRVAPFVDATTYRLAAAGRSLTGQLVDCSCSFAKGSLDGMTLAQIAVRVAEPFGVPVIDLAQADEPFARVQIEEGETAFELLERLARQRAVFLTDNAEGALVIRRRSTTLQGSFEVGVNALSLGAEMNGEEQFSNYIVKGQSEGSDRDDVRRSSSSAGRAVDASVPIHRPKILLMERQGGTRSLTERAEHEAALRRARARHWTLRTTGWRRPDGAFWQVAEEVEVTSEFLGLDKARLLVVDATWSFDDGGEITELTVAPPEGYDLVAERAKGTVSKQSKSTGWDAI